MHPLRLLLHLLPLVLVERGGVSRPCGVAAVVSVVGGFERRAQGGEEGDAG